MIRLFEQKLTHIEHLEDEILTNNTENTIKGIQAILHKLTTGTEHKDFDLNLKFDGSPSLIAGIHPETKEFFVATKSLFSLTPKFYTSVDSIKKLVESPGLAAKLIIAYRYLSKVITKGIYQGDLLYSKEDLKIQTLNKQKMLTFTPNTITYAVPYFSEISKKILDSEMGIVWHTEYSGKTLQTLTASFNPDLSKIRKSNTIWSPSVKLMEIQDNMKISNAEKKAYEIQLKIIKTKLHSLKTFINNLQKNSKLLTDLKLYFNYKTKQQITQKSTVEHFIEFIKFIGATKIEKLKTTTGKDKNIGILDNYLNLIISNRSYFDSIFEIHYDLTDIKHSLLKKLNNYSTIGSFINTKQSSPEGFVLVHRESNKIIKLVDRNEFSLSNFQMSKNRA